MLTKRFPDVPRRSLLAALLGLCGAKLGWSATRESPKTKPWIHGFWFFIPKAQEKIYRSFDARDWARAFVAHVQTNPAIATDQDTMVTWFANALMRGYDERAREQRRVDRLRAKSEEVRPSGMTVKDAKAALEPYSDDAEIRGFGRVSIVMQQSHLVAHNLAETGFVRPQSLPG